MHELSHERAHAACVQTSSWTLLSNSSTEKFPTKSFNFRNLSNFLTEPLQYKYFPKVYLRKVTDEISLQLEPGQPMNCLVNDTFEVESREPRKHCTEIIQASQQGRSIFSIQKEPVFSVFRRLENEMPSSYWLCFLSLEFTYV